MGSCAMWLPFTLGGVETIVGSPLVNQIEKSVSKSSCSTTLPCALDNVPNMAAMASNITAINVFNFSLFVDIIFTLTTGNTLSGMYYKCFLSPIEPLVTPSYRYTA